MRRICLTGANLGQRKHNEFRACALLVPSVRLALVWRSSTLTRGKMLTFLTMQKMCAEVDAHDQWITFIRRSRQIINKLWRTPSESQSTAQNSTFYCAVVRDGMCDWALIHAVTTTLLVCWTHVWTTSQGLWPKLSQPIIGTPVSDGHECANRVDSVLLENVFIMTIIDHEKQWCSFCNAWPYFDVTGNKITVFFASCINSPIRHSAALMDCWDHP